MTSAKAAALRPAEHFTWRSLAGLAAILAVATAFGVLLVLVRWSWPPLGRLDRTLVISLNRLVAGHRTAIATLTGVTDFGGRTALTWLTATAAAVTVLRRQFRLALYLLVTLLGAVALDPAIKLLVGRLRPVVSVPVSAAPGFSFPSGHALTSIVCYGAVLLVFLPVIPRRLRGLAVSALAALVMLIGFSRVALGVHYPSDVIGGWLLGTAWLGVTTHAFGRWQAETGQRPAHVSEGLAPETAPQLRLAQARPVAHPWRIAARLAAAFVLIGGAFYGAGRLAVNHPPAFEDSIPLWLAAHRAPALDPVSYVCSQAGSVRWILALTLLIAPLAVVITGRWRPAVFIVTVMAGQFGLTLSLSAVIGRAGPPVAHLDGLLATSSFPSGPATAVCDRKERTCT